MKQKYALLGILSGILLSIALIGCKKDSSVNDLYKFPATKDVLVLVNIDFTADANTNSRIDLTGKNFVLNAFALDAGGQQVEIGLTPGKSVKNLPVTLAGAHTSFEAVLSLPIEVLPRPTGYALRFELKQPTAALVLATPPSGLDALRGEIKSGTAAAVNNVDLSLASSLAYNFLGSAVDNVGAVPALGSYAELVALFKAKQQTVEAGVDATIDHDVDSYVAAILSGLNYQVLTDSSFQKTIAEKLLLAIDPEGSVAQKAKASEQLAEGFTASLIKIATEVNNNLVDASNSIGKVFTSGFIDTASLPDPASYSNAVFAPLALNFTDSDTTGALGGDVLITAPLLATGVASYNVYFGGEDKASAKLLMIGSVLASNSPLSIAVPTGTAQPAGATRFWSFPVADGKELNIPASLGINNLGGVNSAPTPPVALTATGSGTTSTLVWTAVSGVDSYNLYWSTTSPVRTTSNRIKNVASPYVHKSLLTGVTYYYSVSSVRGGVESVLSSESSVTPTPASDSIAAPLSIASLGGIARNTITWASSPGATSYKLYWSLTNQVTTSSNMIAAVASPYDHLNLTPGTTYYYAVTAVKGDRESALSTVVSSAPTALPAAPGNLAATGENTQVSLSWNAVAGASSYNLYWSTSSPVSKQSTKISGVSAVYIHSGLTNGTPYFYAVTAVKGGIESDVSSEAAATPIRTVPTLLTIAPRLTTTILTWTPSVGATASNLYRSTTTPVTIGGSTKIANATSPYVDTGLTADTPYYYAVSAVFGADESALSNTVDTRTHVGVLWTGLLQGSTPTGAWSSSTANEFFGAADGAMNGPKGIAVDKINNVMYVADSQNDRIQRFNLTTGTATGSIGKTTASTGTCPSSGVSTTWCTGGTFTGASGDGAFADPRDVALDVSIDRLYVADFGNERVSLYVASTGQYLGSIGQVTSVTSGTCSVGNAPTWCTGGVFGNGQLDGQYGAPTALAIDLTNKLMYVAKNYSIAKVNAATGAYIGGIGQVSATTGNCPSSGATTQWCTGGGFYGNPADGGFFSASGVAIDIAGDRLIATDSGNDAVSLFTLSTGAFVGRVGNVSSSTGTCPASGVTPGWCTGGTFQSASQGDGNYFGTGKVGIDTETGFFYVAVLGYSSVYKLNLQTGAYVGTQGTTSATSGSCPASGITPDFCTGGTFNGSLGLKGFPAPTAAMVGPDGYLYVLSNVTSSITRLGL